MATQTFSEKNFNFLVRKKDCGKYFINAKGEYSKVIKKKILKKVGNNLNIENYTFQPLHSFTINRKLVYSLSRISDDKSNLLDVVRDDYVLRQVNRNLRKIYKVKQADRFQIISSVKTLLANPAHFYVCKLDIKSFYESVNRQKILESIEGSAIVSYQTKKFLKKFFSNPVILRDLPEKGLPRGINISATLSEYCMRKFDKEISGMDSVYYYARFVDDIIIFSTEKITSQTIECHLPDKLKFNELKEEVHDFSKDIDVCISYLGYEFKCSRSKNDRKIETRIATRKINKIKGRLVSSFLDYKINQDFDLLKDRLLFLTATYPLKKQEGESLENEKARILRGGILYNYPLIDDMSCLSDLDKFLRGILFSKPMKKRISNTLTKNKREELRKFSFLQGYNRRISRKFDSNHIKRIAECWR